jgi:hypothetical protein
MDIGSIFAAILGRYFLAVVFLFMCSVYCIWRAFVRLFRCFFPLPSPTPSTVEGQQQSENTLDVELTRQILGFITVERQKRTKGEDEEDNEAPYDTFANFDDKISCQIPVNECNICLEPYVQDDHVRKSVVCDHVFHRQCISEWLRLGKRECPCCRTVFVNLPPSISKSESSLSVVSEDNINEIHV